MRDSAVFAGWTPDARQGSAANYSGCFVDDLAFDQRVAHLALDLDAGIRRVLALAFERGRFNFPVTCRIEYAQVGAHARFQFARVNTEHPRRLARDTREPLGQRQPRFFYPFQGQRQQKFDSGGTSFGFAER